MHKKLLSILLCFSMIFPSLLAVSAPVFAETWTLSGNGSGWKAVYPSNNQNDYLQDQQTGSGSVSQDIVGDASYPSTYMRVTNEDLSIRMRVSNANGNASDEFKNFAFVGVDADLNGSVDFFLGAYNPTGSNGRLGIYGSNGAYANTGPSTTGISGKPILSFKPVKDVNYAFAPTGDGSRFNGDEDYFVSFKFSVADISAALAQKGMTFNASTPFRFMTGTAAQDNAFNQDLNGMDKSGWSSKKTWNALGVFSDVNTASGAASYYTVKFDSNTGDTEASPDFRVVEAGGKALGALPTPPTKRTMYFQGWNERADGTGNPILESTQIGTNMTVYAIWSDKPAYTVTFDANGGTFDPAVSNVVTTRDGVVGDRVPKTPIKADSNFEGWSTTASGGNGTWFNGATPVTASKTIYARWTTQTNKAALFYNNLTAQGGALVATIYSNGQSSQFNGGFPEVVRPGYTFGGWYPNKEGIAPASTQVSEGTYYAKWNSQSYTVNFNANLGGGGGTITDLPPAKTVTNGKFGAMPTEPTRAGYQFIEWNRVADGSGESLYPTSAITGNTTVYAVWKVAQIIKFYPNQGDGGIQSIPAVGGKLNVLPQPPSRENYSFMGWATSASGSSVVELKDVSNYTILYAVWNPVYTVNFDANGGRLEDDRLSADILTSYGSVLYLPEPPKRSSYMFGGWNTKADGRGSPFTLSTEVTQQPTQVYANWVPTASTKYAVTFETDGGSAVNATETASIQSSPVSSKDGYTLEGWYKAPGREAADKVNFPYAVTSNTTLYAKWTAEAVSVTLNDNGGYGGSGSVSVALDQAMPTASIPLREGYKFEGYFDQSSGGAAYYDSAMAGTRNWDKIGNGSVLYAQWAPVELIVDFDANGGQYADGSTQASLNQTYDSAYALPSGPPVREGFKFASWNMQADGKGDTVTMNATVASTAQHTVYAIWTELGNVTITYASNNADYGKVIPGSESLNPETGIPAGATAIPNPGYRFQEWQGAGGEQVGTSETYVPSKGGAGYVDGAYTAVFVPSVFSVTLDDNEGSGGSGSVKAEYDQPMPQAIKPLRPGYTFAGYYDQKTEGTLYYDAEMNSARNWNKIDDSSVLYARWTAAEISAVFYANGGSYADGSEEATIEQTYGGAYKRPSQEPVREGYAFSSWNTRQDGQGETITAATPVTLESALSIYAVWTENDKVAIRYAVNETDYGSVSRTEESLNPTTGKALGSTAESNPGYRFVEWQNGKGTPVSTEPTWIPEKVSGSYVKDTFTAVFRAAAIKVVLDDNGGSGGSGSVTATYAEPMPTASVPSRQGYRFGGYYDQRTGGTPYYNADMSSSRVWDKTADAATLYARWSQNEIKGTVIDDAKPAAQAVAAAKIRIVKGNTQYGEETLTDAKGKFTIYNIPAGTYNLIMTIGEKTEIVAIVVKANESVTELGKITFPLGNASSILKLKTTDTPPVVINNLHPEAEQYLLDEKNLGFVKVEMSVSKVDESAADADVKQGVGNIKSQAREKNAYIGLYLDITLDKYKRNTEQESWGSSTGKLKETTGLIQIAIPIPADLQDKTSSLYRVYRDHENEPTHTIQETPNAEGEYLELDPDGQTLTLHVKKFSVYALAYLTPAAYSVEHYVMNADGSYPASPNRTSSGSGLADSTLTVSDLQDNALSGSGVAYGYGTVNGATTQTASVKGDGSLVVKLYYARQSQTPAGSPSPAEPAANSGAPAPSPAVQYDVTFDGAGGVPASVTRSVADGSLLIRPTDPAKEGHRFGGWIRADGSKWNFAADRVHAALILKAEWIALDPGPQAPVLDKVNHFAYMQGYPDGTFRADRNMTRAEVVAMFSRLLTEKMNMDQSYASEFRDVASANWYADAVGYMKRHGVVTGYADGTFGPEDPITRAEFAAIAARFDQLAADEDSTFRDVEPSYWAAAAIASGVSKGWIKGYPDGTFRPEDYVTRAEAVTLVNRMTERRADRSYIDQPSGMLRSYSDLKKAYWAYYDIMEAVTRHEYVKGSNEESWTAF